jgi:hypothetical protein
VRLSGNAGSRRLLVRRPTLRAQTDRALQLMIVVWKGRPPVINPAFSYQHRVYLIALRTSVLRAAFVQEPLIVRVRVDVAKSGGRKFGPYVAED